MSDDETGLGDRLGLLRKHWRITVLVVLVILSGFALFGPLGADDPERLGENGGEIGNGGVDGIDDAVDENGEPDEADALQRGWTNLVFGLELSGGTRIRAPLIGLTAEGMSIESGEQTAIEQTVAEELEINSREVTARAGVEGEGAVEVTEENVTEDRFDEALRAAGFEEYTIRTGVTEETAQESATVIQDKIRESPFAAGDSRMSTDVTGTHYVVVEVPNQNRSEVRALIEDRGVVEVVAEYPVEGDDGVEYETRSVLESDDLSTISTATRDADSYWVPVTLTEEGGQSFASDMRELGFTDEGIYACNYDQNPDDPGYCLHTVVDGEIVYSASMSDDLAGGIESSSFESDPSFRMTTSTMGDARQLQINLRAGATPAQLDIESGTQYFLEPSLAERFKLFSLLTGFVAVLAVALTVSYRYREPKIAVPMLLTAGAEVFLLLGFAAAVGYPLNLAAIAGFIAVVGTGVDDLIIIADEILQEGDVHTGKVFQSRFRRAFWVIGAAAATTIVAMAPLAVLSLGDLVAFALFTIIGVLIGVLITRPAYGNVLRILLTDV